MSKFETLNLQHLTPVKGRVTLGKRYGTLNQTLAHSIAGSSSAWPLPHFIIQYNKDTDQLKINFKFDKKEVDSEQIGKIINQKDNSFDCKELINFLNLKYPQLKFKTQYHVYEPIINRDDKHNELLIDLLKPVDTTTKTTKIQQSEAKLHMFKEVNH